MLDTWKAIEAHDLPPEPREVVISINKDWHAPISAGADIITLGIEGLRGPSTYTSDVSVAVVFQELQIDNDTPILQIARIFAFFDKDNADPTSKEEHVFPDKYA